jgi:hypothetical protein
VREAEGLQPVDPVFTTYVTDSTGAVDIVGDALRQQAVIRRAGMDEKELAKPGEEFKQLVVRLEQSAQRVLTSLGAPTRLPSLVLLRNHEHDGLCAGAQDLHTDAECGAPHCLAVLAPLVDGVTLLVVPGSHDMGTSGPLLPLHRLHLSRGEMLVFDGALVHAGDVGHKGQSHPRLHWHAQVNDVLDETRYCIEGQEQWCRVPFAAMRGGV